MLSSMTLSNPDLNDESWVTTYNNTKQLGPFFDANNYRYCCPISQNSFYPDNFNN